MCTPAALDPVSAVRAAASTLRARRLELLPLEGSPALFTETQGREPGSSTSPTELAELVSSIASVGLLQPILVEELSEGNYRLVAGERRLRALRWGAVHLPDNPHFRAIPAVVCPGPLSEEARRSWQLVENLARTPLAPASLAAALLYERCAVLGVKLTAAGVVVPEDVAVLDDPVERFRALDRMRTRAKLHHVGAPWEEVLRRLGILISSPHAALHDVGHEG
jgi:ParB family chromosome partitioning protein